MKYLQRLGFVMVSLLLLSSFTTAQEKLVGKWKGQDKGDIGYLILTEDGYATFQLEDQVFGGKSFEMRGVTSKMTYEIDRSQYPNAIDFIITNTDNNKELGRMYGIIQMLSEDELQMAMNFETKERPADFSKDQIVFERMK
ncbi:uncharacterized protein (TIGR03067 family) [Nonlabens dokdonensis]|uniref:DUF2147 domain-containing protein n=2 Tax=Nonlabens dokdonensis TaxID=328515 RepID=L7WBR6_NONDD|nr:hypothetical protein [Nonlabens dokdonensis]AGC77672.1 hypothetical protein DDD_2545 [Nonlabens dokdonensis DSW-6]PZX39787.1 uncharacterized protein (TIGR03067 family) [Nonlabens dokdonensis]